MGTNILAGLVVMVMMVVMVAMGAEAGPLQSIWFSGWLPNVKGCYSMVEHQVSIFLPVVKIQCLFLWAPSCWRVLCLPAVLIGCLIVCNIGCCAGNKSTVGCQALSVTAFSYVETFDWWDSFSFCFNIKRMYTKFFQFAFAELFVTFLKISFVTLVNFYFCVPRKYWYVFMKLGQILPRHVFPSV